jgi:excisionase family DNA binding protein
MRERRGHPIPEAAHVLGISARAIRYLIKTGRLGFCRVGRRVLIPDWEIERLLRRTFVKPMQPLDADEPMRPRPTNRNAPVGAGAQDGGPTEQPGPGDLHGQPQSTTRDT